VVVPLLSDEDSEVRSILTRTSLSQRRVAEVRARKLAMMGRVNFMVGECGCLEFWVVLDKFCWIEWRRMLCKHSRRQY